MCRWIAYRGLEIPLEHYVTEPEHSLISQSLNALEATASINGDGFGLGWYGHYKEPGLYHEVRPAWSDENLRHLCLAYPLAPLFRACEGGNGDGRRARELPSLRL